MRAALSRQDRVTGRVRQVPLFAPGPFDLFLAQSFHTPAHSLPDWMVAITRIGVEEESQCPGTDSAREGLDRQ